MRPVTEIRRERLRQLIDEVAQGNQSQFADAIGRSRAQVGFWLTEPDKAHAKNIGHRMARMVEERFGYPAGWLDSPVAVARSMTDPTTALREVLALSEKATDGEWEWYWQRYEDGTDCGITSGHPGRPVSICRAPKYQSKEQWSADAALISAAVNLVRTHGPALLSALEDARRYRWLRDLPLGSPHEAIGNMPGDMWNAAIDAAIAEGDQA